MLKKEELDRLAAKSQTTKINIYREYTQNLFLSLFYQQKNSEHFLFKGGTALKIVYKSPRYSEDLDFSLGEINFYQIESLLLGLIRELQKANFPCKLVDSKETTGGYLAKLTTTLYDEAVNILIQGSQRKRPSEGDIQLIHNDYIPPFTVWLLPKDELVGEKIQAATIRSKPRDFFDIYYLIRAGMISPHLVEKVLKLPQIMKEKKITFEQLNDLLPASMSPLANNFNKVFTSEIQKYT